MTIMRKGTSTAASVLMSEGLVLLGENKASDAYLAIRLALNLSPDDPSIHTALARTCLLLSASNLARYHAEAALSNEAKNLDAEIILAEVARRAGNRNLCLKKMARFANISSARRMHLWLELSLAIEDTDFENALFDITTVIEQNPNDTMFESLFEKGFDFFKFVADQTRFSSFVEGLGLSFSSALSVPKFSGASPERKSIDVIIPVFNALTDLQACLESIRHCASPALGKIILVDDFSDPPTANWMQALVAQEPNIVLLRNSKNLGFTRTVMKGLAHSTSAFPVLLNSDTCVTMGWLDGLWQAMQRRPTTALVGPLSDNGYHQTIMPSTSCTCAPFLGPLDAAEHIERAVSMVLRNTRKQYPLVPLLSGFCLMIRREAYDRVGGFDAEEFPEGYWEVQDLGFKLIDQGMNLVIADDVFVHHLGSASITSERKKRLHSAGLAKMYARYSGLRLLTAARLAACEPEIEHHKRAWWRNDWILTRTASIALTAEVVDETVVDETRPRMTCRILSQPDVDVTGREVCLFVIHAPFGTASEYTQAYIRAVRAAQVYVIVCLVVDELDIPVDASLFEVSDALMVRLNGGYDFAVWADMLVTCPQVWSADRLYFVNDSITGPFSSLDPIFEKIRTANAGFFALTDAIYPDYHAQSYFFGWSKANLDAPALRTFWDSVHVYREKSSVIDLYEKSISPLSKHLPVQTQKIVFSLKEIFSIDMDSKANFSSTHSGWQKLLDCGFPFIKTDLIRDKMPSNISTKHWQEKCVSKGANLDMVNRHVEMSLANRLQRFGSLPIRDDRQYPKAKKSGKKHSLKVQRRRIYFHIGLPKTGSSALQFFLSRNAAALGVLGVSYPFPEKTETSDITSWSGNILAGIYQLERQLGNGTARPTGARQKAIVDRHFATVVNAALSSSDHSIIVLSGEFMAHHLSENNLAYMKDLGKHNDVSIVAFIRDVYDHAMSSWKQNVKADGYRCSFDAYVKANLDNGRSQIQGLSFISKSGIDLKIVNYDYHKNGLASKFMQVIGLDPASPGIFYEEDRMANPSFSYWQCKSIVTAHEQIGSSYLSAMLVNQFHASQDARKDPVISDVDALIMNRLSAEIAWVNAHLPVSERLRDKQRTGTFSEDPPFYNADVAQLMATIGDYITAVKIPKNVSEELLATGLPADFNPEEYLLLHRDVAVAKVGAAQHYLEHGRLEGRPYRAD